MSDEFGTVNLRRGERAREIEVLRQHYRQHREALARMTADAPTDHLAVEYQRLIAEIDRSLHKLNELEGGGAVPPPSPADLRVKTEPGMRPLVTTPIAEEVEPPRMDLPPAEHEPSSRVPLILGVTLLALILIGWLVWRASSDRGAEGTIVESGTGEPASTAPDTLAGDPASPTTSAAAAPIAASPQSHDYGTIRKGTRATRQFEITNNGEEPVTITVARSACRCLYYEHAPVIPPKAKETLTVTVDGAKAKAGELRETVKIALKSDPATATTVDVLARVR